MPLFLLTHGKERTGDSFVNGAGSAIVEAVDEADARVVAQALDPKFHGNYWGNADVLQLTSGTTDFTGALFGIREILRGTLSAPAGGFAISDDSANITTSGDTASGVAEVFFSDQPNDGDTLTIDGITYTFFTVLSEVDCGVLIGANLLETIENLIAAINGSEGAGTAYANACTISGDVVANLGDNNSVVVEDSPGGVAGDPPLTSPSVGSHPTETTSPPTLLAWWRADQRVALVPGEPFIHAMGSASPTDDFLTMITPTPNEPKPLLADADFNGHRSINWDGTLGRIQAPGQAGYFALPVHILMIVLESAFVSNATWMDGSGDNTINLSTQSNGTITQRNSTNTGFVNTISIPQGSAFLLEAFFSGTAASFTRVNGGSKVTGGSAGINTNGITWGGSATGGGAPNIKAAELIAYNGELTGADLTALYDYLEDRYGITLP